MADKLKAINNEANSDIENSAADISNISSSDKILKKLVYIFGIFVSFLVLYEAFFGSLPPGIQRPLYLFLMVSMGIMFYPSNFFPKNKTAELILKIGILILLFIASL